MKQHSIICILLIFLCVTHLSLAIQDIENPKIKWKFKTQGTIRGSAVIAKNNIYFGNADGYVYALNKQDGNLLWKYKTEGAIVGVPMLLNNTLYIASRDHFIYAINIINGNLKWRFKTQDLLPDAYAGWNYFMAAPNNDGRQIIVGSGDGYLYALNPKTGKINWKFKTGGRIRATALIANNTIYQPSNDGYVYVLNLKGNLLWTFETIGANLSPENYSFDRSSIMVQPLIKDNLLIIASRDGNVYAVNLETHEEVWKFSYGTSWAMSASISDNMVFVGWSTNKFFCALDLHTGKEKWKIKTGSLNYTKALTTDSSIYIGSADGNLYNINKFTGNIQWKYSIDQEIFSSLIQDDSGTIFFGSDDGNLYALEEGSKPYKAVFHPIDDKGKLRNPKAAKKLVPYLTDKGFQHLDSVESLFEFITQRIVDKAPSVIVFNYLRIPKKIIGEHPEEGLMRQYLEEGGKVIWMGGIPNYYLDKRSSTNAARLLGVTYIDPVDFGHYFSKTTQIGQNWGLPQWLRASSISVVPSKGITPMAYDEFNQVSIWMKKYHPRSGSGFISCRTWGMSTPIKDEDLNLINKLAVYGLE